MKILLKLTIAIAVILMSCQKDCVEVQNFYEIPIKCDLTKIRNNEKVKIITVFDQEFNEIESSINNNSFEVTPWTSTKTDKKINYDTMFYLQIENPDLTTEIDSIDFLYNVNKNDCGIFVIHQMRFRYNTRVNFTGTFNNNICQFSFKKH